MALEVLVDFGLFELLAAVDLAALAREIHSRRWLALPLLAVSILAPAAHVFIIRDGFGRAVAVVALGTTLMSAAVVFCVLRRHDVREIVPKWRMRRTADDVARDVDRNAQTQALTDRGGRAPLTTSLGTLWTNKPGTYARDRDFGLKNATNRLLRDDARGLTVCAS